MSKIKPSSNPNTSASADRFDSTYFGALNGSTTIQGNAQGLVTAAAINGSWGQPSTAEPRTNFPFDPRISRIAANGLFSSQGNGAFGGVGIDHGGSGAFTRGVKVGAGSMSTVGIDGNTYVCVFQFNPTEIDVSYGFDSSVSAVLNPSFVSSGAGTQSSQGLMLNQSVSFTLLFDRTYEVWTGMHFSKTAYYSQQNAVLATLKSTATNVSPKVIDPQRIASTSKTLASAQQSKLANSMGPYKYGVMWDVWAIERLAGIYGQYAGGAPSGPPAASITTVKFGPDATGGPLSRTTSLGGGYAFGFTGWMTSMEVQYTRFDASMVPTRCAVGLTFEQIYSLQALSTNPSLTSGQT